MKINVYNLDQLVETLEMETSFIVLVGSGDSLHWGPEQTANERLSDRLSGKPVVGGTLILRVVNATPDPQVDLVTRDWVMRVNDIECVKGTYIKLPCKYHKVSLDRFGYTFELLNENYDFGGEYALPQPSRHRQART